MTISPRHWRKARNAAVFYALSGAPLPYVWNDYQEVIGAWQRKRGVRFQVLAEFDRAAMVKHLESLS